MHHIIRSKELTTIAGGPNRDHLIAVTDIEFLHFLSVYCYQVRILVFCSRRIFSTSVLG